MFPLNCAQVCAHTGRETSAHKKTWSAHKCAHINVKGHPKMFSAYISYMSFQIQLSSGKMLHKRNFMHMETLKN